MERTQSILERFPQFYKAWDPESLIYKIVTAFGKRLDESDKELLAILRAHWVDTAIFDDLDKLGQLFNVKRKTGEQDINYRTRLKRAIIEYKGGGTKNAILTSVRMALNLPNDYPIELLENPPTEKLAEFNVNPGDVWSFNSQSINDAKPSIEISMLTEGEKITNPSIVNLETGESIGYNGEILNSETLIISDGEAKLNKKDVTKNLSQKTVPIIPRRETKWTYKEPISEEIGVFDTAIFNESKYAIGIQTIKLGFRWIAHQPATFELKIPEDAVPTDNKLTLAQEAVNAIKATGVRAIINIEKV